MRTLEQLWREYDAIQEEWKKRLDRLWEEGGPQGASPGDLQMYSQARDALKAKLDEIDRFSRDKAADEGRK